MESLLSFLAALIVLPLLGGTALVLVGAVSQVATAPTTPGWQKYLWFLGAGYVLLNMEKFLGALASGSGQ
ncbi:hypothetical protein [Bosea sp. (in: a-proteobacteria)]|jgi:hypothetical protein|uniref:hypothetical protein n=1 Tax=Bosea sp. (in: a-proteobacteria) TaxID=1871050 RepID=UPI002FCC3776